MPSFLTIDGHPSYLGLYSAIIVASFATFAAAYCIWVIGSVRASRRLHQVLIESVLTATLRFEILVGLLCPLLTSFAAQVA